MVSKAMILTVYSLYRKGEKIIKFTSSVIQFMQPIEMSKVTIS